MKVRRIEGNLILSVEGIPNREGSGKLTHQRIKTLNLDYTANTDSGANHLKAKITNDGRSFTSRDCLNQALFEKYTPRINANESEVDYTKYCASIVHLLRGGARVVKGAHDAFQRSKCLKLSDAIDTEPGQVFIETKSNNVSKRFEGDEKTNNGFRTQENAPIRTQRASFMLDIQALSVFLIDDTGDASTRHCSVSKENVAQTLKNLEKLFKDNGVKDVSNIKLGQKVRLKTCVNNVSFKGILFTPEQVLVLIRASIGLLKNLGKVTSHGSFRTSEIEFFNENGEMINVLDLKPEDIELDHEVV